MGSATALSLGSPSWRSFDRILTFDCAPAPLEIIERALSQLVFDTVMLLAMIEFPPESVVSNCPQFTAVA